MNIQADLSQYSEAELERWLHLRAIEWCAWPLFLSQPIVPVLFIMFPPLAILVALLIVDLLWRFVRYSFVSATFAGTGSWFVILLKWSCAIGSAIYLIIQHRYGLAILACVWPLVASFVSLPGVAAVCDHRPTDSGWQS